MGHKWGKFYMFVFYIYRNRLSKTVLTLNKKEHNLFINTKDNKITKKTKNKDTNVNDSQKEKGDKI